MLFWWIWVEEPQKDQTEKWYTIITEMILIWKQFCFPCFLQRSKPIAYLSRSFAGMATPRGGSSGVPRAKRWSLEIEIRWISEELRRSWSKGRVLCFLEHLRTKTAFICRSVCRWGILTQCTICMGNWGTNSAGYHARYTFTPTFFLWHWSC